MQVFYPRSFPRLLAVGFTLVALPLVFALVNNAVSVDRLANRSQNAVYRAVQATQSGRGEAGVFTALSEAGPKSPEAGTAVERFIGLSEQAQALVARSNAQIDRE